MTEKVSTLIIEADIGCLCCYRKIQKVLCKLQVRERILSINYNEKDNKVTISGPFNPECLKKKLLCKLCKVVKDIRIKPDDPPPVPPPRRNPKSLSRLSAASSRGQTAASGHALVSSQAKAVAGAASVVGCAALSCHSALQSPSLARRRKRNLFAAASHGRPAATSPALALSKPMAAAGAAPVVGCAAFEGRSVFHRPSPARRIALPGLAHRSTAAPSQARRRIHVSMATSLSTRRGRLQIHAPLCNL